MKRKKLLLATVTSSIFLLLTTGAQGLAFPPIRLNETPSVTIAGENITPPNVHEIIEGRMSDLFAESVVNGKPTRVRTDQVIVKRVGAEKPERVHIQRGTSLESTLAQLRARTDIVYAEPDVEATAFYLPNDTYYRYQWNFDNSATGGVEAEEAWDIGNGSGVTVAVIDTGVAYEDYGIYRRAPDLAGTRFAAGYDFVNNDSHPNDDNGHGTHVTGTIAETTGNGSGVAGLAFGATVMPIKVLDGRGSGSYSDIADGIRFAADHGARVINLSLGGSVGTSYLEDALRYAYEKGVTIVAAAGNDNKASLSYPAAYNAYVIAVGATRFDNTRAYYSNYGPGIDIVAPGGDTSVDQNGDGYADGILQQTFGSSPTSFGYYFYQGTSMASPHVAAAAAILLSAGTASTPAGVTEALEQSAKDLGSAGYDETYGAGLLHIHQALLYHSVPTPIDATPSVSLTAPANGATVIGSVTISANASDDIAVSRVDFYVDNAPVGSAATVPYAVVWDSSTVSDGSHEIKAVAVDSIGQTATSTVTVTTDNVINPPPPTTVFSDSFEVSEWNGLWTEDSGNRWLRSSLRRTDGKYSADVHGNAVNNALSSIPINLGGRTSAHISFSWFIENSLDLGEYIAFDVSTDGGSTWVEKARLRGNVDSENQWLTATVDLSNISSLRIRFRGTMNEVGEDAHVDNVQVSAW